MNTVEQEVMDLNRSTKAISLWQPWASLWACGRKQYETRSWSARYSGPLIVHAAKRVETDIYAALRDICEDEFGAHWARELPTGALIAICDRVICWPTDEIKTITEEEHAQGNFGPFRYGWSAVNMRKFAAPIPWRGRQKLFDVPNHVITRAS